MREFVEQDLCELLLAGETEASIALRDRLRAGAPDEDPRLYWNFAPLNVLSPFAVLSCVGGESDATGSGPSGLEDHQFAVACRSTHGIEDAGRLAKLVRARLKELDVQTAEGLVHEGREIQLIRYAGPGPDEVEMLEGGQIGIQGRTVRVRVVFEDNAD